MTNKLNRSDYLILDTLHGSNMTDQFHSMTIEEIMEETGNVLGVRMTVYRMVTKLVKLEFVVQMIPETVYYLTYTLSNRTFRVPLEESEIKQYPDLEVVDVGRITPVYGDITADMLSVQFVEKILLLIKNRNYTLIFENNTEQETEVKDELAAEPVSVE